MAKIAFKSFHLLVPVSMKIFLNISMYKRGYKKLSVHLYSGRILIFLSNKMRRTFLIEKNSKKCLFLLLQILQFVLLKLALSRSLFIVTLPLSESIAASGISSAKGKNERIARILSI